MKKHAEKEKQKIDADDVRLAISCKNYNTFTRPLPISYMKELAAEKNAIPLPKVENNISIKNLLPTQEHC